MSITATDLPLLSRLFDAAMALAPADREAWFTALPPDEQRLAPALREMLARYTSLEREPDGLTLPRLDDLPAQGTDDPKPGDEIGPYRLIREIGRGGMGSVWLAERADGAYHRQVALKLPRLAWGAGLAERMARERDIGAMLEHPQIARLYDAGIDRQGRPFLALEYIEGQPIDAYAAAHRLDLRARLRLFVAVARAVAYAHGRLVVHRDIKPSNVLVSADGQVHLLDFGIAKLLDDSAPQAMLTQQQGRVLTPVYASPEQLAGAAVTVQSDVYGLGVLLYELLSGHLPFEPQRRTLGAVEEAVLQGDAPPASTRADDPALKRALRGEVDAIIAKAMRREPAGRYASADAMAQDVERFLAGETVSARPDSLAYRLRKLLRRHWLPLGAGAAVAATALVGGTVALLQAQRALQQAERAQMATQFVTELFRASARPQQAGPASASALLDQGAQLIQARFPNQPDLQAELFGVVGQAYADLGANAAAIEFAGRALKLLPPTADYAERRARASMAAARAAMAESREDEAERYATDAVQDLPMTHEAWADAQVLLARMMIRRGKKEQVRTIIDRLGPALQASGRATSAAMAWVVWLQGQLSDDMALVTDRRQRATSMMIKAAGATAPDSIEMQLDLAHGLVGLNRPAEAAIHREAALASLRSLGGRHVVQAALEEIEDWAFRCHMVTATHADAQAAIDRLRAEVAAVPLPALPGIVAARMDWAEALCELRWGDLDRADRLMAASAPTLLANRLSLDTQGDVAGLRGWVASWRGRHDQADTWLRQRLATHARLGDDGQGFVAYAWAFVAMNEVMRGDLAAARATLAQAPVFSAVSADPTSGDVYARVLPEMQALIELESGQPARALATMPPLRQAEPDDASTFAEHALQGEIRCAAGQREQGLATLRESIRAITRNISPQDVGLARIRAVAGLCALDLGRRAEAAEHAAAARAALDSHQRYSPWFARPLQALEQRLAAR